MFSGCRRWCIVALILIGMLAMASILWARTVPLPGEDVTWLVAIQQTLTSPQMDSLMIAVSAVGYLPLGLVPVILAAVVLRSLGLGLAAIFVIATMVADVFGAALKILVARPRPPAEFIRSDWVAWDMGFPSGHAIHAIVFYGFVGFLIWIYIRRPVWRWLSVGLLALFVLATGISRIYLGLHWPTDVIGGYIIGAFGLLLLICAYLVVRERTGKR